MRLKYLHRGMVSEESRNFLRERVRPPEKRSHGGRTARSAQATNWRASNAFEVRINKLALPRGKQQLEITCQRQAKFGGWSQLADGCYLLRVRALKKWVENLATRVRSSLSILALELPC